MLLPHGYEGMVCTYFLTSCQWGYVLVVNLDIFTPKIPLLSVENLNCLWHYRCFLYRLYCNLRDRPQNRARGNVPPNCTLKRATCFAALLQTSWVAMLRVLQSTNYPVLQQIRLMQVAKSCFRKQKVVPFYCKICARSSFYRPKVNLSCSKWRHPLYGVTPAQFYPIKC